MTNLDIDVEVGGGGGGGSVAVSPLILTANVPTETPLTLVGASGQAADLFDVKDSSGNIVVQAPRPSWCIDTVP